MTQGVSRGQPRCACHSCVCVAPERAALRHRYVTVHRRPTRAPRTAAARLLRHGCCGTAHISAHVHDTGSPKIFHASSALAGTASVETAVITGSEASSTAHSCSSWPTHQPAIDASHFQPLLHCLSEPVFPYSLRPIRPATVMTMPTSATKAPPPCMARSKTPELAFWHRIHQLIETTRGAQLRLETDDPVIPPLVVVLRNTGFGKRYYAMLWSRRK